VPVCNGNEVFARLAFGLDMRFGVTAMGVQQSITRRPPIHQHHLPAVVQYKDLEERKRERQMALREDGRTTDVKQAQMRGCITVVCVESALSSLTHQEQPGSNVVLAYQLRGLEILIRSCVCFQTQKQRLAYPRTQSQPTCPPRCLRPPSYTLFSLMPLALLFRRKASTFRWG